LNKPQGPTSHDIVAHVRRLFPGKTRVGHAGTLDPFAEGVLVLCVGPATRLAGYVQARPKQYTAEITLGATSSTDDPEGEITVTAGARPAPKGAISHVLERFVGMIEQTPPAYSAVHVGGKRAYKLARRGEKPDLPARPVKIHSVELLGYDPPRLTVEVRCSSGTYIRSLARDVGAALGVGGYCSRLVRTAVGLFNIEDALPPDSLDPQRDLISPVVALDLLDKVTVNEADSGALTMGRSVSCPGGRPAAGEVAVLNERQELICIAEVTKDGNSLHPVKVFVGQQR